MALYQGSSPTEKLREPGDMPRDVLYVWFYIYVWF